MTAPQIRERSLTFNFAASVTGGKPQVLEIAIVPLDDASSPNARATFVSGVQSASIELSDPTNTVSFSLIPTYSPGLDAPINYRVMWRSGINSRSYTYDFVMPDQDLTWDQLVGNIANLIQGDAYLQPSDLGVANGVARLDGVGNVLTGTGLICATQSELGAITDTMSAETLAREAADSQVSQNLLTQLAVQTSSMLATAEAYTTRQVSSLQGQIQNEVDARINAITGVTDQITSQQDVFSGEISTLNTELTATNDVLSKKADLVNGVVPLEELPLTSLQTSAIAVPNQAAMLALTTDQVRQGSIALRPDGIFMLNGLEPQNLNSWVSISLVNSVNGYTGAVVLNAADIGALPADGTVLSSQVQGLSASLLAKANQAEFVALKNQVTTFQSNPNLVYLSGGVIPTALLPADLVSIDDNGHLVSGTGQVISVSGGGAVASVNTQTGVVVLTAADVGALPANGTLPATSITGLDDLLDAKADLVNGKVPMSQVDTSAISTALTKKADLVNGTVPLGQLPPLPQTQVTGLSQIVLGNELTASSNVVNRVAALETAVATGGGGGGGGGVSSTAVFYTSATTNGPVAETGSWSDVNLHSPWGIDSDGSITGAVGTKYYLYSGVRPSDVAWPSISANGHLHLNRWNESGDADPAYATLTALESLQGQVNTLVTQSANYATTDQVSGLAQESTVEALTTQVGNLPTSDDYDNLEQQIGNLASKASVDLINATLPTLASLAGLQATNTNVTNNSTAITALQTQIGSMATTASLAGYAKLTNGQISKSAVPDLSISQITNLEAELESAATLINGTLELGVLPQNIPETYVASHTGSGTLADDLSKKADLVGGKVPMTEIPLGAQTNTQVVPNQAAMLALTNVAQNNLCVINATSNIGTYALTGTNPAVLSNWTKLPTPPPPVTEVNGYTGVIDLQAADVGAVALGGAPTIAQYNAHTAAISYIENNYALTSSLSGFVSQSAINTSISEFGQVKHADYVMTSSVPITGGIPSYLANLKAVNGSVVLLTAQTTSSQNGLWVINSAAAWTRPADYTSGGYLSGDTLVLVSAYTNGTPADPVYNNSIWWMSNPTPNSLSSFTIDPAGGGLGPVFTQVGWASKPAVPVAGSGITITNPSTTAPTYSIDLDTVQPKSQTGQNTGAVGGSGLSLTSQGLQVNYQSMTGGVAIKYQTQVPAVAAGQTSVTITHNLSNQFPTVTVWDTQTNAMVLPGVTAVDANTLRLDFSTAAAPSQNGQYIAMIVG